MSRFVASAFTIVLFLASPDMLLPSSAYAQRSNAAPVSTSQPSNIDQQFHHLNWTRGPAKIALAGVAMLDIPFGYAALSPPDSAEFLRLTGNPVNDNGPANYIIVPESGNTDWFAVLNYESNGHIDDAQKIDAAALFKMVKKSEAEDNKLRRQQNMPTMTLTGWGSQPTYDKQTHRVEWAFQFSDSNGENAENFNTRILSRTGDMHIILVDSPEKIVSDVPNFNASIAGLTFDKGQKYSDYQVGDKLAAYGIAGLIAGGAAAAAAKTGLLATVLAFLAASGKGIVAAVVGAFAVFGRYMKRLIRRKQ